MSDQPNIFDKPGGPTGPSVRVRLTIGYDGTDFRGLAPNEGVRTVVGELVRILSPVFGFAPDFVMAGRTDAGVHARAQVLSFDVLADAVDTDLIRRVINARLGPEVVAISAEVAAPEFSARFDARQRRYRYQVLNRETPDPFHARYSWFVPEPLNLALMQLGCEPLLGSHDFSSFCRKPKVAVGQGAPSLVREVTKAGWADLGNGFLQFEIAGSAFCHQMVRSIVGFHVSIGRGKRTAGELRGVIAAKDRQAAEQPAPPHGLTLWDVAYR